MYFEGIFEIFRWESSDILSVILLFFLFIWGIYSVYLKVSQPYRYPRWMDVFSLVLMCSVLGLELIQLREWLRNYPLYYIFSFLGLFIAVTALYSHNIVSIVTSIALSLTYPGEENAPDVPRFGPAEILEKKKDYEGALKEYMVLARIYPYHSAVYIRIANILDKMGRTEEGIEWLKRSFKYLSKDIEMYSVVARYCDLAEKLGLEKDALDIIDMLLAKYPTSDFVENLQKRRKKILERKEKTKSLSLVSLEEEPLSESEDETGVLTHTETKLTLENINELREFDETSTNSKSVVARTDVPVDTSLYNSSTSNNGDQQKDRGKDTSLLEPM